MRRALTSAAVWWHLQCLTLISLLLLFEKQQRGRPGLLFGTLQDVLLMLLVLVVVRDTLACFAATPGVVVEWLAIGHGRCCDRSEMHILTLIRLLRVTIY